MAAALQPLRNETGQPSIYPRTLMTDFDFGDNVRYPTIRSQSNKQQSPQSHSYSGTLGAHRAYDGMQGQASSPDADSSRLSTPWALSSDQRAPVDSSYPPRSSSRTGARSPDYVASPSDLQALEPTRNTVSYALPAGAARRVVERYSLDDDGNGQRTPSRTSNDTKPTIVYGPEDTDSRNQSGTAQDSRLKPTAYDRAISPNPPSSSFRKSLSPAPLKTMASSSPSGSQYPPIMPLSASPAYTPPVAPTHRAYAQQPIYVNQANAMQTYTPIIPPQEEVCMECAMRDQDMADVDVTSPGAWERASDAAFEELRQQELDDEANGVLVDNPTRIRIRGGKLTEQNLKLWLSINPREPTSRQQTLNTYVKSQRALLQAEAAAHNQAMQEAKQLDSRMRDAYSQLRRSAYDMGSSSSPADDLGGVRIKPPVSPTSPNYNHSHAKSHSREITLLENGMIVEHVDVRKEEKEARERRKRQEKRARKSSKSSVMDVKSIISAQSVGQGDNDGLAPYSWYSQASSGRPTSVLTAPLDRPDLPRAFSQASFSDFHSMGSSSPRKTRFFGMRNLSAGWRSQESFAPSGISGSMVDMHVALQREGVPGNRYSSSPIDLNTPRRSQIWPQGELEDVSQMAPDQKAKKKKGGLAKIWRIVTGKNDGTGNGDASYYTEKQEDDLPLAPPPPLSYLVNRGPGGADGGLRHASTPSLPSMPSPKFGQQSPGMSPPTAPSSLLPSPASLRRSGDLEVAGPPGEPNGSVRYDEQDTSKATVDESIVQPHNMKRKSVHSMKSETESRQQNMSNLLTPPLPQGAMTPNRRPISVMAREKSLPPLPPGEQPARIHPSDIVRPRTYYDARTLPPGSGPAHDFLPPQAPFRSADNRRQSFGGTASRPNLGFQTVPVTRPVDFDSASNRSFGPKYDEFGSSRRSLGRLDNVQEHARTASPLPSKRKSKFGLSSLLGKKSDKRESEYAQENEHQFPTMGYSPYDGQDDLTTTGYTTSVSRHSTFSSNAPNSGLRMSVTSRKALEELVQQDADFVAYRYPSSDQRLDLLR